MEPATTKWVIRIALASFQNGRLLSTHAAAAGQSEAAGGLPRRSRVVLSRRPP